MTRKERKTALYVIKKFSSVWEFDEEEEKAIDNIISELEQEPRKGHWIKTGYIDKVMCSICNRKIWNFWEVNDFDYCPNCGAKMAETEDV